MRDSRELVGLRSGYMAHLSWQLPPELENAACAHCPAGSRCPIASLLARLARGGGKVLRTDVDGDLAVVVSESGLGVVVRGRDHDRALGRAGPVAVAPHKRTAVRRVSALLGWRERMAWLGHRAGRADPLHHVHHETTGLDRGILFGDAPRLVDRADPVKGQPAQRLVRLAP